MRALLLLAAAVAPIGARSQSVATAKCRPPASSNEARLLAFFAGPLAFAPQGRIARHERGAVVAAGDLTWMPRPSAELSRSTGACGFQKSENTELAPLLPRPRVIVGLGAGWAVEATWLPPVTVQDATPYFGSLGVSWTAAPARMPFGLDLALRGHATLGHVRGPITCPSSELQRNAPSQPCYGTEPSRDRYAPNIRGIEAVASRSAMRGGVFAGVGVASLTPHFAVDFTDLAGNIDHNTIDVSLTRVTLLAGGSWDWTSRLALSAQLYAVPDDATTGRVGLAWRAR